MANPIMSLEQFAALEGWMEAASKLAGLKVGKPGVDHATVITDVYQKRMRAVQVLTGAKPPTVRELSPCDDCGGVERHTDACGEQDDSDLA